MRPAVARTPTAVWLTRSRITDTPVGDLIADMRGELCRGIEPPRLFANCEEMRRYVRGRGACPEALAAVPGMWRRYCAWMDRHCLKWSVLPPTRRDPPWRS